MKLTKGKKLLRAAGGTLAMLVLLTLVFSTAYFLTSFVYNRSGLRPPPYLALLINMFVGLFLAALTGSAVTSVMRKRGWARQPGILPPIIEALEKIARGDFNIQLENRFGEHEKELFGDLVNSVNYMAAELNQMEHMRQEFISNVSHEIQSPLTSIRGFAQALQNDQLSLEDRGHYLSIIEAESTRLSRITEDLLRLAALDSEHPRLEQKCYRLDKQIRSLILACEPQWSGKDLEMDVSLEEVEITADEDLLSQVWTNLIHNSIKFTPSGGRVSIGLRQQEGWIEFMIQDSGIGISLADQVHIFERFYKADKSRTRSNGGSGLGLAIAKKIVEMHHGEIGVDSQPGASTTFTVRFNVSKPPAA